jgi:DNA primase
LSRLVKRFGGRDALREYHEAAESLKMSKYYSLTDDEKKILERETKRLTLPSTFHKINLSNCRDRRLCQYLRKRKIDQRIINRFGIGYCEWSDNPDERPWSNRLMIPSYDESGMLNFFVGRDFLPDKKEQEPGKFIRPKYKNCDAEKNEIIFQDSLVDWDADITLVEGAIDCIYGPNTISMLGKTMDESTALFKKLRARSTAKVILCLDGDVDDFQIEKLCNLLYYGGIGDRTYYIDLKRDMKPYKDFGEIFEAEGRHGIIRALRKMKQYNGQNIW